MLKTKFNMLFLKDNFKNIFSKLFDIASNTCVFFYYKFLKTAKLFFKIQMINDVYGLKI